MRKSTGSLNNRGTTYVEVVASLAILGICILILVPVLSMKKGQDERMRDHLHAMTLLISEADRLRHHAGGDLAIGRHPFSSLGETHPQGPLFQAYYDVETTSTPGLLSVRMKVTWRHHGSHQKEMALYVRAP
jgi:type II secretory pathway pseudopilin PulG